MKRLYRWSVLASVTVVFLFILAATLSALDETYFYFINFDPSTDYLDGLWIFFQGWCAKIFSLAGITTLLIGLCAALYSVGKILFVKVSQEICFSLYGDNYDEKTDVITSVNHGKHACYDSTGSGPTSFPSITFPEA